jgi:hypothetical protein
MSKVTGVVHFEIEDVVNFDTFNLLNLAREDLWSSGVHDKKDREDTYTESIQTTTQGVTLGQL